MPESHPQLERLLAARRSVRRFAGTPITRAQMMRMLWAAGGEQEGHRLVPSAGGLHTIAVRVAVSDVVGVSPGIYQYRSGPADLHALHGGEVAGQVREAAIESQPWLGEAAAVIAWEADFDTAIAHYADQPPLGRGERYLWLETGCAVQNAYLEATALGLGGVYVGAFDDALAASILGLPGGVRLLGLFAFGKPA